MCNIQMLRQRTCKNLFDDFSCALKILFALRNYGYSLHRVCGIMGHIFADICGIIGPIF